MSLSNTYVNLRELLVEPDKRIGFIYKYCLISSISYLLLFLTAYQIAILTYSNMGLLYGIFNGLILGGIIGLVIGLLSGTIQWLILLKYLPKKWIVASAFINLFYSINYVSAPFWRAYVTSDFIANFNLNLLIIVNAILLILPLLVYLIQGYLQREVLQTYLKNVSWWLYFILIVGLISGLQYVPIAFILWLLLRKKITSVKWLFYYLIAINLITTVIFLPVFLAMYYSNFWFELNNIWLFGIVNLLSQIYTLLVYGNLNITYGVWFNLFTKIIIFNVIQAIAICYLPLQKPRLSLPIESTSFFANSPDIDRPRKIKSIIKKLYKNIDRVWQGDLDCNYKLSYWLAVRSDSSIAACYPVNEISQSNFPLTPLASLVNSSQGELPQELEKTAKLKLKLANPGLLSLQSLSGLSLEIIAIRASIAIIITSFLLRLILGQI